MTRVEHPDTHHDARAARNGQTPPPGRVSGRRYDADVDERAERGLRFAEESGVRFVRLWFTDVLGFLKSFAIPVEELEKAFDEGIGFDGSAVEGFARVEESDMLAKPDPATLKLLPWPRGEEPVARVMCDVLHPDGTPFEGDPRQ